MILGWEAWWLFIQSSLEMGGELARNLETWDGVVCVRPEIYCS